MSEPTGSPWERLKLDALDPFERAMVEVAINDAKDGSCFACETGPPDSIGGALGADGKLVVYAICRQCAEDQAQVDKALRKALAAGSIRVKLPSPEEGTPQASHEARADGGLLDAWEKAERQGSGFEPEDDFRSEPNP